MFRGCFISTLKILFKVFRDMSKKLSRSEWSHEVRWIQICLNDCLVWCAPGIFKYAVCLILTESYWILFFFFFFTFSSYKYSLPQILSGLICGGGVLVIKSCLTLAPPWTISLSYWNGWFSIHQSYKGLALLFWIKYSRKFFKT